MSSTTGHVGSATRIVAGAMSGTSADGVDVAVVRVEGVGYAMSPCVMLHHHRPYDPRLREQICSLRGAGHAKLQELAALARQISLVYAATVNEALNMAQLSAGDLACVAAHGQTLFHLPPLTIQWLDPALLAAEVGATVVSDFRRADVAAGGQGAPLVPFADYILFRHATKNRAVVNIGGIANLTHLPAKAGLEWVTAFDTGPGNCVSDWLMRRFQPEGTGFDADGALAIKGEAMQEVVHRVVNMDYFWARPPKSTDGPAMINLFCRSLERGLGQTPLEDLLATACRATAETLSQAIFRFLPPELDEIVISGGGIHNAAIMSHLRETLGTVPILTTDDLGIRSAAKEALAFALLGCATLDGVAANIPRVTGARRPVVLGSVTPRP